MIDIWEFVEIFESVSKVTPVTFITFVAVNLIDRLIWCFIEVNLPSLVDTFKVQDFKSVDTMIVFCQMNCNRSNV